MRELPVQKDGPLCTTICCNCYKILVRSLAPCDISPINTPNNTNNQGAKGAASTELEGVL